MRRPAKTKAQKQHDKQQRALLRLRKAAVRYSKATDATYPGGSVEAHENVDIELTGLVVACDAYRNTLTTREERKLLR